MKNAVDVLIEKEENRWIEVVSHEEDDYVLIEIRDNAGGIKTDIMDQIFEPYVSSKGEQKGTGLGLYMSKIIIEEHLNGKLSCHNGEEGAVFTVQLPWTLEQTT